MEEEQRKVTWGNDFEYDYHAHDILFIDNAGQFRAYIRLPMPCE